MLLVFLLTPLLATGGGLALSPLLALGGIIAFPGPDGWRRAIRPGAAIGIALLFLVWLGVAQLWSPSDAEQVSLVWAGVLLYGAFTLACMRMPEDQRTWPRAAFAAGVAALAVMLVVEAATGAWFTRSIKQLSLDNPALFRNVGRGASVFVVLAGPAAAMALAHFRHGRWVALALGAAAVSIALSFDMIANAVALVAAAAAFALACWRPRSALFGAALAAALWIVFAPMVITAAGPLSPEMRADMAFSWEWRWETWTYARELIVQRPFQGWGMDASRTFDQIVAMRGFDLERMPLHPHSAALQLWLELGMVGALLGAAALVALVHAASDHLDMPRAQAAAAASALAAMAVLSFVSYGVWQEWWWATAFLAASACILIGRGRA